MRKILNRVVAMFVAGAMTISLLTPAVSANAASVNTVVEIPVDFKNSQRWGVSTTEANIWTDKLTTYSDSYKVSYKLYIPASFFKEESVFDIGGGLIILDATEEEVAWNWGGWSDTPSFEIHDRGKQISVWDEEKQEVVPVDYATVEKVGDFYVVSYEADTLPYRADNPDIDMSKTKKVNVSFRIYMNVDFVDARDSAVYLDDLKIVKSDGTTIIDNDFTEDETVEGLAWVAPRLHSEVGGKGLKLATITDNKVLAVNSNKVTVKVGKTKKISATALSDAEITYISSNNKIATVDSEGVIKGKKAGKTTIKVKANNKTVKVTVTVKKK